MSRIFIGNIRTWTETEFADLSENKLRNAAN